MTTDYRAELKLLFDAAESFAEPELGFHRPWAAALDRARALLDQQVTEGPSDEELVEHVRWFADEACLENSSGDIADSCRDLIARWGHTTENTNG